MEKIVFASLLFALSFSLARTAVDELPWTFYESTCPQMEPKIEKQIKFHLKKDITQITAGLLCLHFHDCFVQGCDAWVVLNGSASGPSEEEAPPNLTLRRKAFGMINDIKERVDKACRIVSCSDITHLAPPDFVSEISIETMDGMFKGRRFLQQSHKSKLQPPKPPLDRGHDAQHN